MDENTIRAELAKTLADDPQNFDKILKLSHSLVSFDRNNVRFSVDSGVIERLGKELVARHETAVSELVKNAYDADARFASLDFINVDNKGGTLVIKDNGSGMNRDQLINGFMRISSSSKIHEPVSSLYKRNRAGKKGIGRFSAQRLGSKLTIITQTKDSLSALKIVVDWTKYLMDDDLYSISNKIIEIPKKKDQGTTLIIEDLREWWSETMIKRVYRYALEILQPFPLSKPRKEDNQGIIDPGFAIRCLKDGHKIADRQSMFYEHALAEIEGFVDENGKAFWSINKCKVDAVTSKPMQLENEENSKGLYPHLSSIRFKAFYFIYRPGSDLIPKNIETYIREVGKEQGGIRLYRNGFRVLPYAEPQDDWLGLDASTRRKSILPVHGNINFFGFVEIDESKTEFIELSSREGLFNNDAYFELIDYLYKSLTSAVNRIASARGRKTTTGQKGWEAKYTKSPKESILDTADDLDDIADELENKGKDKPTSNDKNEDDSNKKKEKAEEFRKKAQQLRDAIKSIDELNMMRVLAGLGLIIGEFTHEIMNYLGVFDIDTKYILDHLEKATEEYNKAIRLRNTFDSFKVYASYFDETISQNVNQELRPIEIRDVIKPFVRTIKPDRERNNIEMKHEINGYDLFTCKMHTSEWASILFNLYSNSKKAIKRAHPDKGEIIIKAGKENNTIFLEFIDNGDGIPLENRDKIFNAFFTTSNPKGHKASSTDELTGTGLGLKIVRDIVESYNGEISIENAPTGFSTNIKIIIPIAKPEEIHEYAI